MKNAVYITYNWTGAQFTGWTVSIGPEPVYSTGRAESIIDYCKRHFGFVPEYQTEMHNGKTYRHIVPQKHEMGAC